LTDMHCMSNEQAGIARGELLKEWMGNETKNFTHSVTLYCIDCIVFSNFNALSMFYYESCWTQGKNARGFTANSNFAITWFSISTFTLDFDLISIDTSVPEFAPVRDSVISILNRTAFEEFHNTPKSIQIFQIYQKWSKVRTYFMSPVLKR
jgi:hypothetical protein